MIEFDKAVGQDEVTVEDLVTLCALSATRLLVLVEPLNRVHDVGDFAVSIRVSPLRLDLGEIRSGWDLGGGFEDEHLRVEGQELLALLL